MPENLKIVLSRIGEDIVVNDHWDCLEVDRGDIDAMQKMLLLEALASTPGVDQFSEVDRFPLRTMAEILEIADRYNKAREIGTEEFPKHIPEYCAVTSDSPTTKAKAQRLAEQESRFD